MEVVIDSREHHRITVQIFIELSKCSHKEQKQ